MMLLLSLSSMMQRLPILKMLSSSWVTITTVSPSASFSVRISSSSSDRAHRIEPRRRLVEEDQLGLERHRARDRRALLHAARELGRASCPRSRRSPTRRSFARTIASIASAGSSVHSAQRRARRSRRRSSSRRARPTGTSRRTRAADLEARARRCRRSTMLPRERRRRARSGSAAASTCRSRCRRG